MAAHPTKPCKAVKPRRAVLVICWAECLAVGPHNLAQAQAAWAVCSISFPAAKPRKIRRKVKPLVVRPLVVWAICLVVCWAAAVPGKPQAHRAAWVICWAA